LERLRQASAPDPNAREVLESDAEPKQVPANLRSLGGEFGRAVAGNLNLVGNRLVEGFDIALRASPCSQAQRRAVTIRRSAEVGRSRRT
jgi:hypothetical protein